MHALTAAWGTAVHLVRLMSESASYALLFLAMCCKSRCRLAAEIVALRSQVAACRDRIDREQLPEPRFTAAFRVLWVVLSRLMKGGEDLAQLMKPATVKRWHDEGYRLWWRWKSRKRGRPSLEQEMQALIRKLSRENPLWAAGRIRDTLVLLGCPPMCDDTVRKYMLKRRRPRKPPTTWLPFLRNHVDVTWPIDFSIVTTINSATIYGFLGGSHDYYRSSTDPQYEKRGERPIMRETEIEPPIQDSHGYLTEMFTEEAVQFIERAGDDPFCLYLAYNAVHHPWSVPDSYVERVQHLDTHDERKLFAGMVLAMDDGVGAVMEALGRKGVEQNTLVLFMSDNGTPRGQGIAPPRQKTRGTTTMSSPGPFNGFKGDTYEGGTRVPFIMYWPDRIPASATYRHPVINLDIAATVMARSGVSRPWKGHAFDGVDLLPFLSGARPADERPHDVLYWRRGEDYAIREGDWKLTWNDQSGPQTIRLFNLSDDPGEWTDLAAAHPEWAQAMQDLFDAWDSGLADNQSGRNPRNRNSGYVLGARTNVAEFNARVLGTAPVGRNGANGQAAEELDE